VLDVKDGVNRSHLTKAARWAHDRSETRGRNGRQPDASLKTWNLLRSKLQAVILVVSCPGLTVTRLQR